MGLHLLYSLFTLSHTHKHHHHHRQSHVKIPTFSIPSSFPSGTATQLAQEPRIDRNKRKIKNIFFSWRKKMWTTPSTTTSYSTFIIIRTLVAGAFYQPSFVFLRSQKEFLSHDEKKTP